MGFFSFLSNHYLSFYYIYLFWVGDDFLAKIKGTYNLVPSSLLDKLTNMFFFFINLFVIFFTGNSVSDSFTAHN